MRVVLVLLTIAALTGCGESQLSASNAGELVRADLYREHGVTLSTVLPTCGGGRSVEPACVEVARCLEPIATEHAPEGSNVIRWMLTGYPFFRVENIRVADLTHHSAEGVAIDETARETATVWVRFAPAEDVQSVASCPGYAAVLDVLREPVPFDVEFEGTPLAQGQRVAWDWRVARVRPQSRVMQYWPLQPPEQR
jgi:hypothetical protein